MKINKKPKKVIIAMSGGVDSSVAAALLKKGVCPELGRRVDVIGVFMKFWKPRIYADKKTDLHGFENKCCTPESEKRARLVAKKLGIPFYVFNFEREFKKRVVDYFLKTNKQGKTPNPCVVCNKEIKFGLLIEKALKLGADYVATGHYALKREIKNQKGTSSSQARAKIKNYKLLKARDKNKDQSYFLWKLNQKQLKHILFPVGNLTKDEVRKLAKKFKLPVVKTPESMEICFIQDADLRGFLEKQIGAEKGKIITKDGKIIGGHKGLWFYTIGQRKGIGLPNGPYYVLDKNIKNNTLIVTKNEKDLLSKELVAKEINWISGQSPKLPIKITAKIRYRSQSVPAIIRKIQDKRYKIQLLKPQRAITPGQSVVFYRGEELLGGGIIM